MEIKLIDQLEKEIAELLVNKLEHLEMSLERASMISRFVLKSLPENLSDEQVRKIIPKLDDEFFELADIVYKHMKDYEEKYRPVVMEKVGDLVEHKHFDEAKQLMNDYFNKKLN